MKSECVSLGSLTRYVATGLIVAMAILFGAPAMALTLGFQLDPTNNGSSNSNPLDAALLEAQLSVDIEESLDGLSVSFTLFNDVSLNNIAGSVALASFTDTSGLFDFSTFNAGTDLATTSGASAAAFTFDIASTTANAASPPPQRGLNESADSLSLNFNWAAPPNEVNPDLLQAIAGGFFNIRLHVVSISGPNGTNGDSDWFNLTYTPPTDPQDPPIPEPATLGLIGMGLAAMALRSRRKP